MSRCTWDTTNARKDVVYRAFTCYGRTFQTVPLSFLLFLWSRNPKKQASWFSLFRVRSPLLTESQLMSSPSGTEMFHFPECRSCMPMCSAYGDGSSTRRVSPFGYLRINSCYQSPEIFAVNYVLLRLMVPRHPSCARIRLTETFETLSSLFDYFLSIRCIVTQNYAIFKEPHSPLLLPCNNSACAKT